MRKKIPSILSQFINYLLTTLDHKQYILLPTLIKICRIDQFKKEKEITFLTVQENKSIFTSFTKTPKALLFNYCILRKCMPRGASVESFANRITTIKTGILFRYKRWQVKHPKYIRIWFLAHTYLHYILKKGLSEEIF